MSELFLIPSVDRLKTKFESSPFLAPQWQRFLCLARRPQYENYCALGCLITGDEALRELYEQRIEQVLRFMKSLDVTNGGQQHTWCQVSPVTRQAIYFDWMLPHLKLPQRRIQQITDEFIDCAFKHAYCALKGRYDSAHSNQELSMAACCAIIGHLFGRRRGSDARARMVGQFGLDRLAAELDALPEHGYSHEGSTYNSQITCPTLALIAEAWQAITGEDRFEPHVRAALETDTLQISPQGFLPPWDNYGWMRGWVTMSSTYLALRTGQDRWLYPAVAAGTLREDGSMCWSFDDMIWTLVWWPEEFEYRPDRLWNAWMIPEVAGAVQSWERDMRLFQYWDRCGYFPEISRPHVNPNAIVAEAFGSIFLMDGSPRGHNKDPEFFRRFSVEPLAEQLGDEQLAQLAQYRGGMREQFQQYKARLYHLFQGLLLSSNSIVIDGNVHYAPDEHKRGAGVLSRDVPGLQVIASESAEYYRPVYDVERMLRTSVQVFDRFWVVVDDVETETEHEFTWQVYTRPELHRAAPGHVQVDTAEQNRLNIVATGDADMETEQTDFPLLFEPTAHRIQHSRRGRQVRFEHLLYPQKLYHTVRSIETVDLTVQDAEGETVSRKQRLPLAEALDAQWEGDYAAARSLRATLELQPEPGRRYFLRINRLTSAATLKFNGVDLSEGVSSQQRALAPFVPEITRHLKAGANELEISISYTRPGDGTGHDFEGAVPSLRGPVTVLAELPAPAPAIAPVADGAWRISVADEPDVLVCAGPSNRRLQAQGVETNARCAAFASETLFAFHDGASFSTPGKTRIFASHLVSLSVRDERIFVQAPSEPDLPAVPEVVLETSQSRLFMTVGRVPHVTWWGAEDRVLGLRTSGQPININEEDVEPTGHEGPFWLYPLRQLHPHQSAEPAEPAWDYKSLVDAVMRARAKADEAPLVTLASHEDWRINLLAIDSLGRLGLTGALPFLIKRLREELAVPDPNFHKVEDADWLARLKKQVPDVDEVPDVAKWYRVKYALVEALGRIGDENAVPVLNAILERGKQWYMVLMRTLDALNMVCMKQPQTAGRVLPVIEHYLHYPEVNTRTAANRAWRMIQPLAEER